MKNSQNREKRINTFLNLKMYYLKKEELLNLHQEIILLNMNLNNNEARKKQNINFINMTSQECFLNDQFNDRTAILIFASATNPGGGVLKGSKAQEEDLALHSTWYFQASKLINFYNQTKYIYDDKAIFSKSYFLFDKFNNEIEKSVFLIACAAPNINAIKEKNINIDYEKVYFQRLVGILNLAKEKNIKTLILGAWGTGVFGFDVNKSAKLFKKAIECVNADINYIFAIPSKEILEIYKNEFNIKPKLKF